MISQLIPETREPNNDEVAIKILSSLYQPQRLKHADYYFMISAENSLGNFSGLVSIEQVMEIAYPNRGIAWAQIPFSYLQPLFLQKFPQLIFPFAQEPLQLTVDNICTGEEKNELYPVISTDIGDVFINALKGKYQWHLLPENKIGAIGYFYFGHSNISISLLKTLSLGDIFLIDNISLSLFIGEKKWMSFKWTGGNSVELEQKIEEQSNENTTIELNKKMSLKSVGTIPVTVSFLLFSKSLQIEEIESLSPGQQITLPDNIIRHITLTVNGIAIAQGELVKVGERFAVEIQQAYTDPE
ncbi:FliM/FliN family flagellar motor switch protein [Proteus columbae]|uniref:FliM/FliN family flagellar motor switch protein n=1 Tax=Proteus columbae TaxID=1987580 RepID=UPI000C1E434F|nr:FliM/FliN family flagellar motor switch protein [Proteus columbae]